MAIESVVSVRYSDLDPYNHVTSSRYIDFVEAALQSPAEQNKDLRAKMQNLTQKGVQLTYRRAIPLVSEIRVRLEPEFTEKSAHVKFQILNATGDVAHSEGVVEYSRVEDLNEPSGLLAPVEFPEKGSPRIFRWKVVNRFDDLSALNEVPISRHFDLVIASRWLFLLNSDGVSAKDLMTKGWAFFLTSAQVDSHKPIHGVQTIEPRSWISKIERGGAEIVIAFQIMSENGDTTYSSGKYTFAIIDLSSGIPKRTPMPPWIEQVFFEKR